MRCARGLLLLFIALCACERAHPVPAAAGQEPPRRLLPAVAPGPRFALRAEDFDVRAAMAALRALPQMPLAAGVERLREIVNDPARPINAVDLDEDGRTDYVVPALRGHTVEFLAHRSSLAAERPDPDPVCVGFMQVDEDGGGVRLSAGYPTYVTGYQSAFYAERYTSGLMTGLLLGSLLSAPTTVVVAPAPVYGVAYRTWARPVPPHAVLAERRTTYYTQHRVAVTPQVRPATFSAPSAARVESRLRAERIQTGGLTGAAQRAGAAPVVDTRVKPMAARSGVSPPPPAVSAPSTPPTTTAAARPAAAPAYSRPSFGGSNNYGTRAVSPGSSSFGGGSRFGTSSVSRSASSSRR